ncbi:MAG TPA: DUF6491 family protein [Alphaproteobacteria bacterium]|nr:DUF6491 family protein [Alphaproteobacteria bacterium]
MVRYVTALFAAISLLAACQPKSQTAASEPASIPFVEFGNIYDWAGDGTRGIYIESSNGQWYYATFIAPCIQLPFAETIGFKTIPPLPLDKFDSIIVRGEQCSFATLDRVPGLPKNTAHHPP